MLEVLPDGGPSRPVSPPTQKTTPEPAPDTSPAKAWADALAQAKDNSPQQTVKVKPGDSLASIAESHGDTLSSVEQANPQIQPPWLLPYPSTVFLPKKTPAEIVSGVDNADVKPIITAMAHANGANQGPQGPAWKAVTQTTYNMLINDDGGAYPEEKAAAEVKQLNALEPGNAGFAKANNAALAEATKQWQQMGVTKPQLSPIINAYDKYKQATSPAAERQAENQLNTAIEKSLTDAASQAGSNPQARSQAITDRAANIQLAGPQDPAFQTAVDNANYDLQVTKPAQLVAKTYATALAKARANGQYPDDAATSAALAAANQLKTVTQNAGNSYYAGQIIQASQGTIDSITKDMGSYASESFHSPGTVIEFNQIYGDLSQSVAAANKITLPSGSNGPVFVPLSPGGKAAADMVANDIVKNLPKNLTLENYSIYNEAATYTIGQGDGTALTLATAVALKQQGHSELAAFTVVGAARGLDRLASKTKSDITAFATTTANLDELRATWGPFMTHDQLVKATNGYLADHSKDVVPKANAQLGTISQDGDAIVEAEAAWRSYGAELQGVEGQGELSTAAASLTANNQFTAFAVGQSKTLNEAIAAAIGPAQPSGGGGSVVQSLLASPAWSLPKSTRSFANATLKWLHKLPSSSKVPFSGVTVRQGTFTTLSLVGLGLTAEDAASGLSVSDPQSFMNSVYVGLGFIKYTPEAISGLAKANIVQGFLNNKSAFSLNDGKLFFNLPNGSKFELTGLTDTGWFKAAGSAYYTAGALVNVLDAFDDSNNVTRGFDIAEAVGNGLNAAKPLVAEEFGEAAGEAVGATASGIGWAAVIATLAYQAFKSSEATNAFHADSSKFLQDGLGLNSGVAGALSAPDGRSDLSTVAAELRAYAKVNGLNPAQLLHQLNGQPVDEVAQFLNIVSNIASGTLVFPRGGSEHVTRAQGLQMLKYWADATFGKNKVG